MEPKVFWTSVEFHANEKDEDGKVYTGGMVYAFVLANDAKSAMSLIENELLSLKKEPFNFEFISPYEEEIEWEDDEATRYYFDLHKAAEESKEVVLDDFYLYEKYE